MLVIFSTLALANPPNLPMEIWGQATIYGNPAEDGLLVQTNHSQSSFTQNGNYNVIIEDLQSGTEIKIVINGIESEETFTFESGTIINEDITLGIYCSIADFNSDGYVNGIDLSILSVNYGRTDCVLPDYCSGADANRLGQVNLVDLAILGTYFGTVTGDGCEPLLDFSFDCSSLNDCSGNGQCVMNNLCECDIGYVGDDCAALNECGDGYIYGAEICDDNNTVDGDGCSSSCEVELDYGCIDEPSVCTVLVPCNSSDINIDGIVDRDDFYILADNYGRTDCSVANNWCEYSDIDNSTIVNFIDAWAVYSSFDQYTGPCFRN